MKYRLSFFYSLILFFSNYAQEIDYSNHSNWAVLPSDTTFNSSFFSKSINDSIDVFYVYPTLITDSKDKRWNVSIDDKEQQDKIKSIIKYQASAWSKSGNMYVPYYRQAHLRSYYNLEKGGRDALLYAYNDVKVAFEYYLKNFNKGKGIILAGHSQGTTHLSMILRDFFDGKELQKQLVAAYLPGIGISKDEYKTISLMIHPNEIGGFVSWNTYKRKIDKNTYHWHQGKSVVNPVTWDLSTKAERNMHKGFLFSNDKIYKQSFSTHLKDGIIWVTIPHFPYRYMSLFMKNYHMGDVNFFWEDIKENSLLRSEVYLKR
jgi:hypothetical protein